MWYPSKPSYHEEDYGDIDAMLRSINIGKIQTTHLILSNQFESVTMNKLKVPIIAQHLTIKILN